MTVVKRKGRRDENGSRRDSAVDTMHILCNVTEKGQEEETIIICWKKLSLIVFRYIGSKRVQGLICLMDYGLWTNDSSHFGLLN